MPTATLFTPCTSAQAHPQAAFATAFNPAVGSVSMIARLLRDALVPDAPTAASTIRTRLLFSKQDLHGVHTVSAAGRRRLTLLFVLCRLSRAPSAWPQHCNPRHAAVLSGHRSLGAVHQIHCTCTGKAAILQVPVHSLADAGPQRRPTDKKAAGTAPAALQGTIHPSGVLIFPTAVGDDGGKTRGLRCWAQVAGLGRLHDLCGFAASDCVIFVSSFVFACCMSV